jgi:hypothetical protein
MHSETFFTPGDVRLNLELPAGKIEIVSVAACRGAGG